MATLSENITQAINDFDNIQQAIINKGVDVPSGIPTSEYGTKIEQITSGEVPVEEGSLEQHFLDVENIIKNDTSGYRKKYIQLLTDSNPTTTFTSVNATEFVTSDGATYTGTSFNHTWDTSFDKQVIEKGMETYKTRWVITYYSNELDDNTSIALGIAGEVLYMVIDNIKFTGANFSTKYLLRTFKLINEANFHANVTSMSSMLTNSVSFLELPSNLDLSNIVNMGTTFNNAYSLKKVNMGDAKITTFVNAFSSATSLISLFVDVSNVTSASNSFSNAYSLVHAYIKGIGITMSISQSARINRDSLIYILNNAQDMTGQATITITLGAVNLAKLTPEEIAISTQKNITLA